MNQLKAQLQNQVLVRRTRWCQKQTHMSTYMTNRKYLNQESHIWIGLVMILPKQGKNSFISRQKEMEKLWSSTKYHNKALRTGLDPLSIVLYALQI